MTFGAEAKLAIAREALDKADTVFQQIGSCELELVNGGYANRKMGIVECVREMADLANEAKTMMEDALAKIKGTSS